MKKRSIKTGEYLAIDPRAVGQGPDDMYIMVETNAPANEQIGDIVVVHIRGALSHFETSEGDSYEAILKRVEAALGMNPKAIVLRIHSEGGLVAGLNETVFAIQRMAKEAGVRLIAYVDELAASAAYAICCACDEIVGPPSAIMGSVGAISTMASQAAADEAMGIDYRLITSGARKADGHVHAPISDEAVSVETARVQELAGQFFALVSKARGLPTKKIQSLEAGIFLAKDAVNIGLADDVMSWDEVCLALQGSKTVAVDDPSKSKSKSGNGNKTDRRAETTMSLKLDALIVKTEMAIASETNPTKLTGLKAALAAYQATKAKMESDDSDDDADDSDDGDDEDDDSKSEKAAKKAEEAKRKAEAAKHKAKAAEHRKKAEEAEEAAKKCMEEEESAEDEEEKAQAALAASYGLTPGALSALLSQAEMAPKAVARLDKVEAELRKRDQKSRIDEALAKRRITPGEAKMLAAKKPGFVSEFLETRQGAIVNVNESVLLTPDTTPGAYLGPEVLKEIDRAVLSCPDGTDKDKFRAALVQKHQEAAMKRANGHAERY